MNEIEGKNWFLPTLYKVKEIEKIEEVSEDLIEITSRKGYKLKIINLGWEYIKGLLDGKNVIFPYSNIEGLNLDKDREIVREKLKGLNLNKEELESLELILEERNIGGLEIEKYDKIEINIVKKEGLNMYKEKGALDLLRGIKGKLERKIYELRVGNNEEVFLGFEYGFFGLNIFLSLLGMVKKLLVLEIIMLEEDYLLSIEE